jgi:ABC-type nitrate/sulfonate/bicarbonate transport system substrate-binding protein
MERRMTWFTNKKTLCAAVLTSGLCFTHNATHAADHLRVSKPSAIDFYFAIQEVGITQGIFAKREIEIETITLDGSAKQHQAMTAGSTDIALGAGPDMGFIAKGSPEKAVAVMAEPPVNMYVLVAANANIRSIDDLRGKRVGVSTMGSLTYWLATQLARRQNWGDSGFQIIPMGNIQAEAAAFVSGNLDAAVASLEGGLNLEAKGQAKLLTSFDFVDRFLVHVFFATNDLMAKNPDALRRYLKGWFETVAYAKSHRDDTIRITRETTRLTPEHADKVYDVIVPTLADDGHFNTSSVEVVLKSLVDLGTVDKMPEPKSLYTEEFLK